MENKSVYIPSLDAKDIYISNNYIKSSAVGYNIRTRDGALNYNKFINTLDFSLDLLKLREVYKKVFKSDNLVEIKGHKQYSRQVINVTFSYSNKLYNRIHGNIFVKFGYNIEDLELKDNICLINGELIAVKVNDPVHDPVDPKLLGKYFIIKNDEKKCVYEAKNNIPTLQTRSELRKILYENGFYCDGIHYIRFKRTSGSARVGKCLFINERLYYKMHKWELCGLSVKVGQEIDLAALESYISLSTSSIIGTIKIKPENILIIDDYVSSFKDEVIATKLRGSWLKSSQQEVTIQNSIWDGQSLIDPELLGDFSKFGMVLLRNRFFKSCCFNTNIQDWFRDQGITETSQLHGFTYAKDISEVKLITTPSSIKYLKFAKIEQWLDQLQSEFGVVKHDKSTHFFDGTMVQTHYQLINTLQLFKEDVEKLLKPTFELVKLLRTDPAVVRYYIKYPEESIFGTTPLPDKNSIVFAMMGINDKFAKTKYYQEFLNDLIRALFKNLKCGHVLVNGNYSTLFGNPIEMLQQTIGTFKGISQIGKGNVYSKRFAFDQNILGSRSPHVTMGNIWLPVNKDNALIDKYFNLSKEIVCVNSINENTLQRLSGADFDSDTVMLTDNEILISAAKRNYEYFKVPTSLVEANKTKRCYTAEQKADLDIKTSVNKIGEIINMSQILNSLYWDNIAHGQTHEQNHDLYCDIATLDVMSGIEIDKAKKEFMVDNTKELNRLKQKYKERLTDAETGKNINPHFFAHISKGKGYYNPEKKMYTKHRTSMDYLQTVINSFRFQSVGKLVYLPFSSFLNAEGYKQNLIKYDQIDKVVKAIRELNVQTKAVWVHDYLDSCTKHDLSIQMKQDCIDFVNRIKFSYSTMYRLLLTIEEEKYRDISSFLFTILFSTANCDFFSMIKQSEEPIPNLILDSDGNIDIYGLKFKKVVESFLP